MPRLVDIEGGNSDYELSGDENETSLGSCDRMRNQELSCRQRAGWHDGEDLERDRSDFED